MKFHIFAIAALGKGLSGSDRIFIEFAKRLNTKYPVEIYVWKEGYEMCQRQDLTHGINFKVINVDFWCKFGFFVCYIARILHSVWLALTIKLENTKETIVYSASEFWMDSLPALILKLRFPNIRWIAAWFQTAPNPLIGFSEGNRQSSYKLSSLYYWFMQLPIKPLIKKYADIILVNNQLEVRQFSGIGKQQRVLVMLGAVNIEEINKYQRQRGNLPKIYDAVFQGRFHPQKGVVELVDIWKLVTKEMPEAKMAMIGDGSLMKNVKLKIKKEKLEKNIKLFGWIFDGSRKYKVFQQSKIVVHPAFYDSGGMASAEAMAFGLPCVGFELLSYQSYYPRGMVKAETGNLKEFADLIIELLEDKNKRDRIGKEAQIMIREHWSWDQRVNQLLSCLST